MITQLEQFARMTLAKRAIFGIGGGSNAHAYALVDRGASASTSAVQHPMDMKGIWDALDWASGLALSLPAFPATDTAAPAASKNVTSQSAHLAAVASATKYVDAQSNVRV